MRVWCTSITVTMWRGLGKGCPAASIRPQTRATVWLAEGQRGQEGGMVVNPCPASAWWAFRLGKLADGKEVSKEKTRMPTP